jgi:hypothetical protein
MVCHQADGAQVGSGDSSPGDMAKGYGQGIMPRATPSRVNPPLSFALSFSSCPPHYIRLYPPASRRPRPKGPSDSFIASAFAPRQYSALLHLPCH